MTLFDECVGRLGKHAIVIERGDAEEILDTFDKHFPFTAWGRINWNKITKKRVVSSIEETVIILKEYKKKPLGTLYIIGCDATLPLIKSRLNKVIEYFDDVEAINPWTWLFCPTDGWVIEIDDDGSITIGFI